jgi:hypothetical protein
MKLIESNNETVTVQLTREELKDLHKNGKLDEALVSQELERELDKPERDEYRRAYLKELMRLEDLGLISPEQSAERIEAAMHEELIEALNAVLARLTN